MRTLLFFAMAVALSGCLSVHPRVDREPEPIRQSEPVFRPETFFAGETRGAGTFEVRGRGSREVSVVSHGETLADGTLRLRQTITFEGDAPTERVWTLRHTSEGYVSTLTDADGPVRVSVHGNELRVRYGMSGPLVMEQRLYLRPDGQSALNLSTVRWLGVPVARLTEEIRRVAPL